MSQEFHDETEQELTRRRIRPGMAALWGALLLLLLAGLIWLIFRQRSNFTKAEIEHSYPVAASSRAGMEAFEAGLVRYSADGISFLSTRGREQWNISISMNHPKLFLQGGYGAVADLSGLDVVVFDKNGECGRYRTTDPIIGAAVSSSGVTAVALERDLNSLICFYDRRGLRLDIEISLEMMVSGYPMAMALSPDGSGLVLSMASSQGGTLNSQLVFYNFTVGRSETNRLVGFFNHEGRLLTQIDYLSSKRLAAVLEDRLEIYSLEQENKPELKESIVFPGEVTAYTAGQGHEAFLCLDPGSGDMKLTVCSAEGAVLFTQTVESGIKKVSLGEKLVLVMTEEKLHLWDYSGNPYFTGNLPSQNTALFLFDKKLIQFDGSSLQHYRFR